MSDAVQLRDRLVETNVLAATGGSVTICLTSRLREEERCLMGRSGVALLVVAFLVGGAMGYALPGPGADTMSAISSFWGEPVIDPM